MIEQVLKQIETKIRSESDPGRVADYIPELAGINPRHFGMSICLADGSQINIGDADIPFSIQSISKVFTLAIALGRSGVRLWDRVGREPSTTAFNSIIDVELAGGRPKNPFVNAGAIVVTDVVLAAGPPKMALAEILQFVRTAATDEEIYIDSKVSESEKLTGHRNWSLAHFLKSCGNLTNDVDRVLGTYFHQCALELNCEQLARAGRFIAGLDPHRRLVTRHCARSLNALMLTCGQYDGSGEFAFRVGMPAKSGVGGGILAVVPGIASIAVWSPGLDSFGNSKLGTLALQALSESLGWSLFNS